MIIDPGLYMTKKTDVFWITQRRSVPTAFKLFTGMLQSFNPDLNYLILSLNCSLCVQVLLVLGSGEDASPFCLAMCIYFFMKTQI